MQIFLGCRQLLFQAGIFPVAAAFDGLARFGGGLLLLRTVRRAGRGRWRGVLKHNHEVKTAGLDRSIDRNDLQGDVPEIAALVDARLLGHGGLRLPGLEARHPQSCIQALAGHFQEIVRRFSGCKLKVRPGISAHMNNI